MAAVTHAGEMVAAQADTRCASLDSVLGGYRDGARGCGADGREGIVIERLDRSMAYAIPTWCSTSLG